MLSLINNAFMVLSSLILNRVHSQVVPQYLGCYRDNRDDIILKGNQVVAVNITASRCNIYCFTNAYLHAATRNGKECHCGDLHTAPSPDKESLCDAKCFNDEKNCGGKDAYSIFSTGIKEDEIEDIEELEVGCLEEKDEQRLIREHKVDLINTNSPHRCIAYCKVLGYPHAGLQYSLECYCGLAKRTYPLVQGCYMRCKGNPRQRCGGQWKMMIYSTGITKPPPGVAARGCFEEYGIKKNINITIINMDPNKCISYCYTKSFLFAHIFQGTLCLCGKSAPASRYRVNSVICDITCRNNPAEHCGGEKHVNTYSTGLSSAPLLGKLVGCYKDENENLLHGPSNNLGQNNSVSKCITKCLEMGYAFAGLRNTWTCDCSQTSPKRIPVYVVPDVHCSLPCPGNQLEQCGTPEYTAIYRTGLTPLDEECFPTVSKYNGKKACSGQILFRDDFNELDTETWQHSVKISGEDGEFVTYTSKRKNIYTTNGKLIIRPTPVTNNFIRYGQLNLKGCTGRVNSEDCTSRGKYHHILPPIESGQICTRKSFNFTYGNVTVRAKMPVGDWVVPQIWMKPSNEIYGPGYMSGKFLLVSTRGNLHLMDGSLNDLGIQTVESGFQVASELSGQIKTIISSITSTEPLSNDYVEYIITWAPDKVLFYVNGKIVSGLKTTYQYTGKSLLDLMTLDKEKHWSSGTILAPFDQQFYLCLGLSVGGIHNFPDGSVTNGTIKPWRNGEVKGRLKFWLDKDKWESTWSNETKLEVDFIKVTAL